MSQPVEEQYVVIDADLDTADDDRNHFSHLLCTQPSPGPAIAYCGEWFIAQGVVVDAVPNPCPDCVAVRNGNPCPACGKVR